MDETLTEKEQIEEIRAWWKENGAYVIAGLVIGIGKVVEQSSAVRAHAGGNLG